jgi:hypothetical protein
MAKVYKFIVMAYYRKGKKEPRFNIGAHFSRHVHGMFVNPRRTIKTVVDEKVASVDVLVPLCVVIIAGIMSAIGANMWNIIITPSYFIGMGYTLRLIGFLIGLPIYWIFAWIIWTGVFHFLGSIVSGKNVSDIERAHVTLKLVGLCMVPAFLNILPLFGWFTGLWIWMLIMWSMERNYSTSRAGAFIIALPYIFVWVLGFISKMPV